MENIIATKKRSYYIPIVIGLMILSFIKPISYATEFLAIPTRCFLPDPEQPLIDELKKEEELFPTQAEPSPQIYPGRDHQIMIDNPDYERIMTYNQSQREKRFEYRKNNPIQNNSSVLISMMYHFAGQVTLFFLIIIFSLVHLAFSKKNGEVGKG